MKSAPRLKRFTVVGWMRETPASNKRVPMREMRVQALSGLDAAKTYARCLQIPEKFWNDGSDSPMVVIRVA